MYLPAHRMIVIDYFVNVANKIVGLFLEKDHISAASKPEKWRLLTVI